MRKISGMYGVVLLLLICFYGGYSSSFFKLYSGQVPVQVPVPDPCPRWTCKSISAVWVENAQVAGAFFNINKNPIYFAWKDLYARTCTETLPITVSDLISVTLKTYNVCNPTCGKDPTSNWQATQEVLIPQGAKPAITLPYYSEQMCTAALAGTNSNTANDNTAIPPGWKD